MPVWLVLHQLVVLLYGGAMFALVASTSLLLRSVDDTERKHQARLVAGLATFLAPALDVGVAAGIVHWISAFSPFGLAKLFACSPPYVHLMFAGGLVATVLGHAFKKRAHKVAQAAEKGDTGTAKAEARTAFVVGVAVFALVVVVAAFAILKVPSSPLARCVP